jgi:signal transduction histidine kinase
MPFSALWRTTTFRLTALYSLVFSLGVLALLGMVYLQSAVYLTHRVDGILKSEADALAQSPRPGLRQRIAEELILSGGQTTLIALFSTNGLHLAGNLDALPPTLRIDGPPLEVGPSRLFAANARLLARGLPSGDILVVGRDVNQLRQIRAIIASALLWSGISIILVGLACATAFSIRPLQRLGDLQAAGRGIAQGDLRRRMPVSQRRDELDMLATTVNTMMDEVERLMAEIKGSSETIAHDLLTPLTRASTQLHRLQQSRGGTPEELGRIAAEVDEVLDRFRAILRISELEARGRRAGFSQVDLSTIVAAVTELYQPLAEAEEVWLSASYGEQASIEADPKLLMEAVSNLVDNAIKFTGRGGAVRISLAEDPAEPRIVVQDSGPGIPAGEREAVLQRFYRGERNRHKPGSGLGLSVVAAIVRLHGFELVLEDAAPGVRATIVCRPGTASAELPRR